MARSGLNQRRHGRIDEPAPRPPHPHPSVPMVRKFLYWRRVPRLRAEHLLMAAMVALAVANAVRLLAS